MLAVSLVLRLRTAAEDPAPNNWRCLEAVSSAGDCFYEENNVKVCGIESEVMGFRDGSMVKSISCS